MSVDQFIAQLRGRAAIGSVANPYNCYERAIDADQQAFCQRCLQLAAYLRHRLETAQIIMVAEAPGFQGARFSGLAMTSERLLSGSMDFVEEQDILGQQVCTNELAILRHHRCKRFEIAGSLSQQRRLYGGS